ncbi:hypothetical protein NLG97_g130 [Lecanicillium saksenae]|uniref:Uncharacterized protein n=1 Tax=Lecanicillium saksenae TaxID=468837 RepID=A0ACC1RAU3_9HYPO|nr:hypothetical protein NLG97_g130 [Lecanicillium saksenae]
MKASLLSIVGLPILCSSAFLPEKLRHTDSDQVYNLHISQSSFTLNDGYDASFNGSSNDGKYMIDIQDNSGTITQNGRVTNVVVSQQIPWAGVRTLYAIMGVNSEAVLMGWIYCTNQNTIEDLWLEDTTGAVGFTSQLGSSVVGYCQESNTARAVTLSAPDEDISVALPTSYPTMDGGANLSLTSSGAGSVMLDGNRFDLAPFAVVDCSDCQSASGQSGNGWFETHSVMKATESNNICLGIFYLPIQSNGDVQLAYMNCFREQIGDQVFHGVSYQLPTRRSASLTTLVSHQAHLPH